MNNHNSHKKELKRKFKSDFDKVQSFVNEFDFCGFISAGAPIDEYDCLTSELLISAYNGKTRVEMKDLILHEIEHHFGIPDITILTEPEKTKFFNDIENLIDKIQKNIRNKK